MYFDLFGAWGYFNRADILAIALVLDKFVLIAVTI